jgi:glyoxylase-like metal-dependent hydrolase (beta-lactamase superfamily II)
VLLQKDIFNLGIPSYQSEFVKLLNDNAKIKLFDIEIIFHHFPGHSEGSSLIEIEKTYFSGDLIFKSSIGRFDFPFSDALKMKNSLKRVLELDKNFPVYPGHGLETTIKTEEENLIRWIN